MNNDQIFTIFKANCVDFPGNYEVTPGQALRIAAEIAKATSQAKDAEIALLRKALQFYAEGHHFVKHDPSAWDTVSGEPMNFEEDEANTATVEDGSIAKLTLEGRDLFVNEGLEEPETYRGGTLFRDLSAEDKEKVNLGILDPDERPASVRLPGAVATLVRAGHTQEEAASLIDATAEESVGSMCERLLAMQLQPCRDAAAMLESMNHKLDLVQQLGTAAEAVRRALGDTRVMIPEKPTKALLRPFYGCPPEELELAWAAMYQVAKVMPA